MATTRSAPLLKHLLARLNPARSVTYMPRPGDGTPRAVTLIPGDGIGPLVTGAVEQVMDAMHAPVYFEKYEVYGDMKAVPAEVLDSIRKNKVCLKGGLATPMGGGVSSLNVQLRKELDLYASLVNCFNLPGLPTRHENVDIVVIRENTEGEYSGLEHEVVPGVVESLKRRWNEIERTDKGDRSLLQILDALVVVCGWQGAKFSSDHLRNSKENAAWELT
ncbi:hypothetical protein LR48_Vigan06g054700 [Vigna angularis]|uniref:Isopropylmalate dehydrogenase-like domain-containing protein n=1 Tax=Phaseolus angularis TaxID=3914 RepID=A0A0L9URA2_PHAAN|nr:hypothetical protein LR48_Vigan06g054700 [Vigna angularis]